MQLDKTEREFTSVLFVNGETFFVIRFFAHSKKQAEYVTSNYFRGQIMDEIKEAHGEDSLKVEISDPKELIASFYKLLQDA